MTYGNPHLRMRWQDLTPRSLREDISEIVERLRLIYPDLVLFGRGLHLHGIREPRYETVPVKFYANHSDYVDNPWLDDGLSPYGLALRVPWPEDIVDGDPERLIGGRQRRAYEDDRATYRRFGRVVYLGSGMSEEIVYANKSVIAGISGVTESDIPDIRYFRHSTSQESIEFLFDADDSDLLAFIRNVRHCMHGLTTSVGAVYDVLTGEPIHAFPTRPASLRWHRQCAIEDHLYLGPNGFTGRRVEFIGPNPRLLKKWREEVGLPYGRKADPKSIKTLGGLALRQETSSANTRRLPDAIGPTW